MNERIKELLTQATTIEYGSDNGFDKVTIDQEKFAELIVKGCAELVSDFKNDNSFYRAGNVIENYFGVE